LRVTRIVADIAVPDSAAARRFYRDILGLDVLMDMGWIATYGSHEKMAAVRVRSTLTVGAERKTMSARWERSEDGTIWLPWMDVRFVSIDS
jgi:hypothetical protein